MRIHSVSLLFSAVLTACSSSTPTQSAMLPPSDEQLASSTSSTSWEARTFRHLPSMPQPDGYDLDAFVGDPRLFPHTSSYNPITSLRFGKVKTLLEAVLSASSASLADGTRGNWCAVQSKAAAAGYQVRRFYDT